MGQTKHAAGLLEFTISILSTINSLPNDLLTFHNIRHFKRKTGFVYMTKEKLERSSPERIIYCK